MESSDPPDASSIPKSVGRYPILSEAGRGSTGVVYVAEDPRLRRKIALKVLPQTSAVDRETLERFRREGRVLASLNHPSIATIHSFEEVDGLCFFTMEFIAGETLSERLRSGPLPPRVAIEICSQVASALEAAHAKGIIHRNLSSQNVRFTPQGLVKILDFGMTDARQRGLSEAMFAVEDDPRADIWAFGSLLLECLTGHPASAEAVPDTADASKSSDPDLDLLPKDISQVLRGLLGKCLAMDEVERPDSMTSIRRELDLEAGRLAAIVPTDQVEAIRWPNNLPLQPASFVGRLEELKAVKEFLSDGRLVTLTGIGGCGKTRLAVEVARQVQREYPDGTWLIELGAVRNPDRVVQTVAQVLGLRDQKGQTLTETLLDSLESKKILFLFDSCEHLLSAVSHLVGTLLLRVPNLFVLATSHERLGISGEKVLPVPPLGVPAIDDETSVEALGRSEAVQLFTKRAAEAQVGFGLTADNGKFVGRICRRLDGIPLALELAATRVRVLSVEEINQRLDDRFRLLRGGRKTAPPRLQTLRATMDWSYDLLNDGDKELLRALSVFTGGHTLESATSVCKGLEDLPGCLSQLVERSLVTRESREGARERYRMLETVRQYASEKLEESGESEAVQRSHCEHFVSLAHQAEPELRGPKQAEWLETLETEQGNFLAAIAWCSKAKDEAERAYVMARPLAWFWLVRGYLSFGRSVVAKVLALPMEGGPHRSRAQLLDRAGLMARVQSDFALALSLHEESLNVYRELGLRSGIASALGNLANVAVVMGDYGIARQRLEEALAIFRGLELKRGIATNLVNLAVIDNDQGRFEPARARLKEAVALYSELGDTSSMAAAFCNLGISLGGLGQLESARTLIEESIGIYRDLGEKISLCLCLEDLSRINAKMENHLIAAMQLRECLGLALELGERQVGFMALEGTAELAAAVDEPTSAALLFGAARSLGEAIGASFPPRMESRRDAAMRTLRSSLDEPDFREASSRGEVMPFESAAEFALDWLFGL